MIYPFMHRLMDKMEGVGMTGFLPEIGEGYATPEDTLMLIIGQDPDNIAVRKSRQLSRTNDDRSADMLWDTLDKLKIPQDITFPWNTVPWMGMAKDTKKDKEMELGRVYDWGIIPTLLDLMPNLRVVVLMGKGYAWTLEDQIHALRPEVEILTTPHPSKQGLIPRRGGNLSSQELADWFRDEMEAAGEYALAQ